MPGYNEGDKKFTPVGVNGAMGQCVEVLEVLRHAIITVNGVRRSSTSIGCGGLSI